MKKCLPIIFAAILMVSALTGCASQIGLAQQNSSPEQNNATAPSGETTISQPVTSTTEASSPTVSPNASAAYEKLIASSTKNLDILTARHRRTRPFIPGPYQSSTFEP